MAAPLGAAEAAAAAAQKALSTPIYGRETQMVWVEELQRFVPLSQVRAWGITPATIAGAGAGLGGAALALWLMGVRFEVRQVSPDEVAAWEKKMAVIEETRKQFVAALEQANKDLALARADQDRLWQAALNAWNAQSAATKALLIASGRGPPKREQFSPAAAQMRVAAIEQQIRVLDEAKKMAGKKPHTTLGLAERPPFVMAPLIKGP